MMHFEIDRAVNGQFIWRLKAGNQEIIAASETYTTKQNCEHAIAVIKQQVAGAPVQDKAADTMAALSRSLSGQ